MHPVWNRLSTIRLTYRVQLCRELLDLSLQYPHRTRSTCSRGGGELAIWGPQNYWTEIFLITFGDVLVENTAQYVAQIYRCTSLFPIPTFVVDDDI